MNREMMRAPRRKPICEIEDGAGEEARLGDAEQEAHGVEARRPADKGHCRGDQAPAHHDARDPDACTEPLECEIARDLEQEVADEEDAGAGPENARAEPRSWFMASAANPTLTRSRKFTA
jgi:hypothetical protein